MEAGGTRRAQIVLIGGLLLAVMFVGLALVVNSAIYAENTGTRETTRTGEVLADHPVTANRLERSLHTANFHSDTADYDERHAVVGSNVSEWQSTMLAKESQEGRYYESTVVATTNGTRAAQDQRGMFVPANSSLLDLIDPLGLVDKNNWLTTNDTAVRAFEMNVTRDELATRDPTLVGVLTTVADATLTGSTVFWAQSDVDDTDDEFWRLYLLEDGNNVTAFVVEFDDYDGDGLSEGQIRAECSARGEMVDVLVSEGRLVGDDGPVPCPAMRNLSGRPPRDLYYVGGDDAEGTYHFIVDKPEPEFRDDMEGYYEGLLGLLFDPDADDLYYDTPASGHPYTTTAIYNATAELTYADDSVQYSRNVTVPSGS